MKVITGLRRVGKSYLLFNLFKEHLLASGVKESQIIEVAYVGVIPFLLDPSLLIE